MKALILTLLLFTKTYPHDLLKFRDGRKLDVKIINIEEKYIVFHKVDDTTAIRLPLIQLKYFRFTEPRMYGGFYEPVQKVHIGMKYYYYDLREARKAQRRLEREQKKG